MRSPDRRHAPGAARLSVMAALALWLVIALALPYAARAASPDPTPEPAAGDPRSSGQGPGLVGDPLFAIGVVALIGVLAVGGTLLYVRATPGGEAPRHRDRRPR